MSMWSARAVTNPLPKVSCGGNDIDSVKNFKYLGYHITEKLRW
ncbi:unnamed protein product, partial [Rotaria sp. Silwood1]